MSRCDFDAAGLIGDYWLETGGEFGPYGCPIGPEYDVVDPVGRRQSFERGSIAWSRDQRAIVGVCRLWDVAVFEWKIVDTFHYDYFRYEVLHDGVGGGHTNVEVVHPTQGRVWVRLQGFGSYVFRVKGCDGPGLLSGEQSRQGWTVLVSVGVGVTAGAPPVEHPPVTGLFAERWHLFGGWEGPLGMPVAAEEIGGGDYHIQRFDRGIIATYPEFGPDMAILAYQRGTTVVTHWGHVPNVNPNPPGFDTSLFEAIHLDAGDPRPEFRASAMYPDAFWIDWAHDATSSNHLRFLPQHAGRYLIRVTDPEGRQFGVQLTFRALSVDDALPALDGSPTHAFASQSGRAQALARRYVRQHPVELFRQNNGEDISMVLTAHLHAASVDNDFRSAPGELPSRLIAAVTLRDIPLGEVGTDHDYDMTLKGLMVIAFRYRTLLTDGQREHLFRELVPAAIRGSHDEDIETVYFGPFPGPETENHLLMIESTRYLTNQYLHERTGDARYDNLANGMFDWLFGYLHDRACHDFIEFNSRTYQRQSTHAVLNLYEFATDHTMTVGARIVLDYLAVKFAVSSSRKRQIGPFRRRKEHSNLEDLYDIHGHPHTGFWQMYAGPSAPDGDPYPGFPDDWSIEGLIVGLSTYRPPAAAYVLAMTAYPAVQHRFFQGPRPTAPHGEETDPGVETYFKSPSFLLTAGGMFLNSGSSSDSDVELITGTNGTAIAQCTTLMPTRADVRLSDLIRFDPWPDGRNAVNTAVEHGFACGVNLRIPDKWLQLTGTPAEGPWYFLNFDTDLAGYGRLGFFVAAYRTTVAGTMDNLGLIYATEATPDFAAFTRTILERNHFPVPLAVEGEYRFAAHNGDGFTFKFWTDIKYKPYINRFTVDGRPASLDDFSTLPLVEGPYLNSDGHTGALQVRYPACDSPLELNFRSPVHATRTGTPACPQWYQDLAKAYLARAMALFYGSKFAEASSLTRESIDQFRRARRDDPSIGSDQLRASAGEWHAAAQAAHPGNVPVQLAAAGNAWQLYQFLATEDNPEERQSADLAAWITNLSGYLAFGSPTATEASAATALGRGLFAQLPGDHRLDIAGSWAGEGQFHHEVSFNPTCPDPLGEQRRQRECTAEALAILAPMAAALPDPGLTDDALERMAATLVRLIGLTFGATEVTDADRAAELARTVYANLPGRDHRIDVAESWAALSLRHQETSFVPGCPDPAADQLAQRNAATKAFAILLPMVRALPDPALAAADLERMAGILRQLIGFLTFGSPDSAPSDHAAEAIRVVYANLQDRDHRIDVAESWAALSLRHQETSFVPGCPDPAADQRSQRRAAREAVEVLIPIGDHLPDPAVGAADMKRIADILDRSTGLLVFGAPPPPDPEMLDLQRLADTAATLRDKIRELIATS
jgi:hypothetical protein